MIAPVSAVDYLGGGSFSVGRAVLADETSDGSYLNTADFIASGCASYVRTSANHRGGMTGAMRIAHLADSFRLRAEVHGPTEPAVHLCMAIPNCTYYESLVTSNPAVREPRVGTRRSCPGADLVPVSTSFRNAALPEGRRCSREREHRHESAFER